MKKATFILLAATILLFTVNANAASFTDNDDETVTDNVTTLMWQQEDDNKTRTWAEAITYCKGLSLAKHADWRLPSVQELKSIIDDSTTNPAIDATYFPNTNSSYYWSSTTYASYTSIAWNVSFSDGYAGSYGKTYGFYVRCVRPGQ